MALRKGVSNGKMLGMWNLNPKDKTRDVSTSTASLVEPCSVQPSFYFNFNETDDETTFPSDRATPHAARQPNNNNDIILPTSNSKQLAGLPRLEPPKVFGLPHCFAVVLGSVLSASILFTVNGVHSKCGGLGPALLVWFCSGAMNFVGAQCYAEITAATGETGGEFILIYRTLNPMPAFMQIWITLLAGTTMASVTLAMLFSEYAMHIVLREYGLDLPRHLLKLVAALQLGAIYALHCISTRWVARLQIILTILKFCCLGIIISAAVRFLVVGDAVDLSSELQRVESVQIMDIFQAFAAASPVFLGWQRLTFVAGEVHDVTRNIPISMSVSTIISPIVAILLHLSFAAVLSDQELQSDTPVIVLFAHRAMGRLTPVALLLVSVQALCSMNTGILAGTRTLYAAARESMSPEFWAMLHIHKLTFVPAALTLMTITMPMLFIENLNQLITVLGAFRWFPPMLVAVAVIVHRWRFPRVYRPFKVPAAFPFIFITFCLVQTIVTFIQHPLAVGVCLLGILPAFPLFLVLVKLRRPMALFKAVEKVTEFMQKLLLVAHDLGHG